MRKMKGLHFFWIGLLCLASCQGIQQDQAIDVDELVLAEEDFSSSSYSMDPIQSPQEVHLTPETLPQIE